jgi:hypothetical protein
MLHSQGFQLDNASMRADAGREFDRAVNRGWWSRLRRRMQGRRVLLLELDAALQTVRVLGQRERGLQTVPVRQIIGSVDRHGDFDLEFRPLRLELKGRWISVQEARYRGNPLPPVELIKLGEGYFVKDGHHRISVARAHGQEFIEAVVVELDFARHGTCPIRDTQLMRALAR